jgi:hypothetical protein
LEYNEEDKRIGNACQKALGVGLERLSLHLLSAVVYEQQVRPHHAVPSPARAYRQRKIICVIDSAVQCI